MALKIEVRREVMFAPARHVTLWTLNPTYTSARGRGMIVTETDGHGLGANRYPEWTTTWRRFRSPDGGATWQPASQSFFEPSAAQYRKSHVGYEGLWAYWLEPQTGRLIGFHSTPDFSEDFRKAFWRFYYTVSDDGGLTWDDYWSDCIRFRVRLKV